LRTRVICGNSRSSSRKLPRVIRSIAPIAWASVKSSGVEGPAEAFPVSV
jgi:hypothetical protein